MDELNFARLAAIIISFFASFAAFAQSSSHYDVYGGFDYTVIDAKNRSNATQAKLVSNVQTLYGIDFQAGHGSNAWYFKAELLNYSFKQDPGIAPITEDGLSGQQKNFEFGRWSALGNSFPISIRYAVSYRDVLYVDYPSTAFHLKSESMPGALLDIDFPLTQASAHHGRGGKNGSGFFAKLHFSDSLGSSSAATKNALLMSGTLSFDQRWSNAIEAEWSALFGYETLKTIDYSQARKDLGITLTLRFAPGGSH